MTAAGYEVETQEFEYPQFSETGPSAFEQVAPTPTAYVLGEDYTVFEYSGDGDVQGPVTAGDLALGVGNASTSGCQPEDFAAFPAGDVALLQRGTCPFGTKVANAAAAGAVGAVLMNQGNTDAPDRNDLCAGTLGSTNAELIPAVAVSYPTGVAFSEAEGLVLRILTQTEVNIRTTANVLAETPGGDDDNVIMVGAHLDSVLEGPGINDNGSGSAAILEVALQMAELGVQPDNKVRFAWWGAEESGLIGSNYYVFNTLLDADGNLTDEGEAVALYLNFDMVGSPNYVRFVYDGDGDAFGTAGPPGSDVIEADFEAYFDSQGLPSEDTEFSGRSDYRDFILIEIPSGGLFTGAEGIKTPEQAEVYGGEAGVAYDPCYHQACDTIENVNLEALDQNLDAIGNSVLLYAFDTSFLDG